MPKVYPLLILLVWTAAAAPAAAMDPVLKTLPGHVPAPVAHLQSIGPLPASNRMDLALGLPLRDRAGLQKLVRELYDPASTNFHRYLTPQQFTEQFGPTKEDYQAVINFARANGFSITHTHANRVLLDVNAKAADIEKAFHLTLRKYRHPTEARDFFAPDAEPKVSSAVPVQDICGLSDFGKPRPMLRPMPAGASLGHADGSGPDGRYMGTDFRNAYAPGTALDGSGQMVGLFQLTGYDPNDIFAYEAEAGLPNVPLRNVLIGAADGQPWSGEEEVCLDIELVISMATNLSAVVVFEAPNQLTSWPDVLNAMASSNQIKQFSSSWFFPVVMQNSTVDQIFQQMAAQGQSFFQASGDSDAYTGTIYFPCDSPYITLVGGTTLSTGTNGAYVSETVWNWTPNGRDGAGSSGGISQQYNIPDWQTNLDMTTNLGSATMRNLPDVALTADNVYVTHGSGTNGGFGGTSLAAPLWAGFMALVNQQTAANGNPPPGFLNPAVYALGNSPDYTNCFHDITAGDNTWSGSSNHFFAVPGYDLCTGWGTPAGTNLINALAGAPNPLALMPQAGFVAVGAVGGPFNGTSTNFSLSNLGSNSSDWSLINTSSWLAVSLAAGTIATSDQTNFTVSLTAAANLLPEGCYADTIVVTNDGTGVAQAISFSLQLGGSLVCDGGFESGTFSHWLLDGNTITGGYIFNGVETSVAGYDVAHSGSYGAFLGDTNPAVLSQVLPTCPGQVYRLSFWLNNTIGGSPQLFAVNWNTNSSETNTIFSLADPEVILWTNVNLTVMAGDFNTRLQFVAENRTNYFGLDEISVVPVPVPAFIGATSTINGFDLSWSAMTNATYRVQCKTNLLQPDWIDVATVAADSGTMTFEDTNALDSEPQRFYRVVAP
jgi:hypothetical protein